MGERKGRNFIFWLDLECTGSEDDDDVLELGASITDRDLNELDYRSIVFPALPDMLENMKPVVTEMHTKNGLLEDVKALGLVSSPMERQMILGAADEELAAWVRSLAGGDHMLFAGSGVAHYDRKYIKRDFPQLNDRLTHFALDIGTTRRISEFGGLQFPESHYDKTHRALDDARMHCNEMRVYVKWVKEAIAMGMDHVL